MRSHTRILMTLHGHDTEAQQAMSSQMMLLAHETMRRSMPGKEDRGIYIRRFGKLRRWMLVMHLNCEVGWLLLWA